IVGVVGTPGSETFAPDNEARLFLPLSWRMPTEFYFVAKGSPTDATGGIRGAIADLDPNLPIQNLGSLHDAQLAASAIGRQVAGLFTVFGFAALLITIVGLYGTIASTARRRRRELGLRRALGGSTIHLVTTAAAGRPWLLSSGLLTGTGLAALLAPALPPDMTGERLVDPLVFLAIPLTLATLSAVAIYLPSRRAIEADPMQELGAD